MTYAIKVHKRVGNKIIPLLKNLGLLDRSKKIDLQNDYLMIPLIRALDEYERSIIISQINNVEFIRHKFESRKVRPRNLIEALESYLTPSELAMLPRSFDIIGDIAIVEIPPELDKYSSLIGEAITKIHPRIKTVFAKAGPVVGTFRIRKLKHVYGEFKTITIHKEYGCILKVDVLNTYFSPRLATERHRIASQVSDNELIVDMFAGVGPYAIMIAKKVKAAIIACDINPYAIKLLNENMKINKLLGQIYPIHGEASTVFSSCRLKNSVDRIIMNLPEKAKYFLDVACKLIKPGGIIHYYTFASDDPIENAKNEVCNMLMKYCNLSFSITSLRIVKVVAPRKWQVAVDIKCFK